jgi:hypothetical protein
VLVINRRRGQRIKIGDVVLVVLETHRSSVRLGFEGGRTLIIRAELEDPEAALAAPNEPPEKLVCERCGGSISLYAPGMLGSAGSVTHFCRATGATEIRPPESKLEREMVEHATRCFRRQNPI